MSQPYQDTKKLQRNKVKQFNCHAVYIRHLFECFNHFFRSIFTLQYLLRVNYIPLQAVSFVITFDEVPFDCFDAE